MSKGIVARIDTRRGWHVKPIRWLLTIVLGKPTETIDRGAGCYTLIWERAA